MKTILAPIDFSKISDPVVKAAANLARSIDGRLILFHVVQPPIITSEYGAVLANVQEIIAISVSASTKQLLRRQKRLQASGLKVSVAQVTGIPVTSIIEQARKSRAAYIVIGSHGHSALYDLLAGSTATGVIKRAPCPVLVVPPAGKKSGK
jgi:nucleotide-binding universal stress UspA family protein|uniref:universal stress protein n=1 Tax=Cephaloticoccus sp. TaxID=1985742 RepID=UPI00404B3945